MKTCAALGTSLFALASFTLWAQQSPPAANQPSSPASQQSPSSTEQAPPVSSSANPQTPTADMSPVNGELVNKLDSKTAKSGDSVVVQTKTPVKTAGGTEIPKGSKLVGHVIAAQPSQTGQNSQVVLQFDRVELKGGKTVPVHSQIQSISPASASGPNATADRGPSGAANGGNSASGAAQDTSGASGPSGANGGPPAGTLVAKTGQIAIRTTSIPGVLVANNAPGEQDPRMANVSSILLGARSDIELDGGTLIVVGVSPTEAGTQ
jgi:hypothetical protein